VPQDPWRPHVVDVDARSARNSSTSRYDRPEPWLASNWRATSARATSAVTPGRLRRCRPSAGRAPAGGFRSPAFPW
jgi:hypothetical protein